VVALFTIGSTAIDVYFPIVQYAIIAIVGNFIVIVQAARQKERTGENREKQKNERTHFHK
jgi:hypothetical protein